MDETKIYHEKQKWQLCAIHALNNLFQEERFTKANFDEVCMQLSPDPFINPHRSILGLGNYDINVIFTLLKDDKHGHEAYDCIWFNKKKNINKLCLSQIYGFILNIPSKVKLGFIQLPIRSKHWIAVRCIGGIFYNLNSKLDAPEKIGTDVDLKKFLKDQISDVRVHLFIVVTKTVAKARSWEEAEPLQERSDWYLRRKQDGFGFELEIRPMREH